MLWHGVLQFLNLFCRELDVDRSNILIHTSNPLGAWDGDDIIALLSHPRQRQLTRCHTLLRRQLHHVLHQLCVLRSHRHTRGQSGEPSYLPTTCFLFLHVCCYTDFSAADRISLMIHPYGEKRHAYENRPAGDPFICQRVFALCDH